MMDNVIETVDSNNNIMSPIRIMNEIELNDNQIVFYNNNSCVGIFFYKVTSKKLFKKWSKRYFICTNKDIHFFKYENNKRKKIKTIYFSKNCFISGLESNKDKYAKQYLTFSIFYKTTKRTKVYTFKSYNIVYANELYKILNKHSYKNIWGIFKE